MLQMGHGDFPAFNTHKQSSSRPYSASGGMSVFDKAKELHAQEGKQTQPVSLPQVAIQQQDSNRARRGSGWISSAEVA